METKTLYRYTRSDGGVTVSPNKPNCDYVELFRILAGEDKAVTKDGVNLYPCIDVDNTDDWYEVDYVEEEE